MQNNLFSFVGFALKSGAVVFGTDNLLNCKEVPLIIASPVLSENALNKLKTKFYRVVVYDNYDNLNLKGKVCGITNSELAKKCYQILTETNKGANTIE